MFSRRSGTRRSKKSEIWDVVKILIPRSETGRSEKSEIWDMIKKKQEVPDLGQEKDGDESQIWDMKLEEVPDLNLNSVPDRGPRPRC